MPSPEKRLAKKLDDGGLPMTNRGKRKYDAGERDKMKMYGDEPDSRPRTPVFPHTKGLEAKRKKGTLI